MFDKIKKKSLNFLLQLAFETMYFLFELELELILFKMELILSNFIYEFVEYYAIKVIIMVV